jgi:FtsH-binding integral membrane protein
VSALFVGSSSDVPLWLFAVSFFAGFGLLIWLSSARDTTPLGTLQLLLTAFAATEGVFFGAVAKGAGVQPLLAAFGIATAIALGMAVLGYLNPRDMAGLGPVLMIALLGLLALAVVSIFITFEGLDLAWSALGLVLFSVYTAYDVNQIRKRAAHAETDHALSRIAISGAIDIYLDLSNLVIQILRLRAQT